MDLPSDLATARDLGIYEHGCVVVVTGASSADADHDPTMFLFDPEIGKIPSSGSVLGQVRIILTLSLLLRR